MPSRATECRTKSQSDQIQALAIDAIAKGSIWLPGLASPLAALEWATLHRNCGLSLHTYGTDRLRSCDRNMARHVFVAVTPPGFATGNQPPIIVEHPFSSEKYYQTLDLSFYRENEL